MPLLIYLSLEILVTITRTRLPTLVELIHVKNSVTIFISNHPFPIAANSPSWIHGYDSEIFLLLCICFFLLTLVSVS